MFSKGIDKVNEQNRMANRQTGPELLRIIAMLMIVFHHFAFHSGIDYTTLSVNNAFLYIIEFGGKIGVNIFVLITGFFSSQSRFTSKRIFKLLVATEFYSIILMVICLLIGAQPFSKKLLLQGIFPLFFGDGYWFVSSYIILYAFSPVLNIAVMHLSKKTFSFVVVILTFVYLLLPNTLGLVKRLNDYGISTFVWFVLMYMIGAYLRKSPIKLLVKRRLSRILLVTSVMIMWGARLLFLWRGENKGFVSIVVNVFASDSLYSIMPFIISILFFIVFYSINVKVYPFVLKIAKATFGIYLIHDNIFFREFLWQKIIQVQNMYQYNWFILYSVLAVLILFVICAIIEIIRDELMDKKIFNSLVMSRIVSRIDRHIT